MVTLFGRITNAVISKTSNAAAFRRPLQSLAERLGGARETFRLMLDAHAERMRVAMPAQVVSWNASKQTLVAQPLIREKVIDRATGTVQWVQLPQIPDVPVQFPQAGGFVMTMPIQAGDEVLLVFQDMCMDGWFTSGGIQNWNLRRRHDLSDAIAIPGVNSTPNLIQNIASDAAELRTKDGNVKVRVEGDALKLLHGASTSLVLDDNGAVLAFGSVKVKLGSDGIRLEGTLRINGFQYLNHVHTGVTTGPGSSGPVAV